MATPPERDPDSVVHGEPEFSFTHDAEPSEALLCGFSQFGLAGLTAANFLVEQLDLTETGHVGVDKLPAITPFENGVPRHHTRLFSRPDVDVTVLVGELFIPLSAADSFSASLGDWLDANGVREIAVLSGVPLAHGPDEHRTFYVATEDYREKRLADADTAPMGSGFLDGVNAGLLARGVDSDLSACVFTTPVHQLVPDVEAAIRLVDTASGVYDLDVDTQPLKEFAAEVTEYYAELNDRVSRVTEEQRADDRMYM
ncbi:proteasome assembly chaperone family protein [Halobacterium zhouii]|uniref:proteasome assembly chaperone family protein n=1 Tax=Halobacterium zhouii TaxID=2902624 RepID=UPI001E595A5F|nr:PAC2 family protein [Halobacterium zhouii]